MKKIISIVLVTLVIIGAFTVVRLSKFRVNNEAVQLQNVEIDSNSVSFDVIQTHSGYYLRNYNYIVVDNTLYIEFYGTMFPQMQLDDLSIVIEESNVSEVKVLNDINKIEEK